MTKLDLLWDACWLEACYAIFRDWLPELTKPELTAMLYKRFC